jgi:hypothetical protein
MRRSSSALWLLLVAACVAPAAAGCGSDDGAGIAAPVVDFESRLLADTGTTWLVDRDGTGAPMILTAIVAPKPIAATAPRDQALISFFQGYADVFGVGKLSDELTLVSDEEDRAAPGTHRLRLVQHIPGSDVRVLGADLLAYFDPSGALRYTEVGFVRDLAKISATPTRTADEARTAVLTNLLARDPHARFQPSTRAPELVVHRAADGRGRLTWHLFVEATVGGELEIPEFFVDARDLSIVSMTDSLAEVGRTVDVPNAHSFRACGRGTPKTTSTIVYDDAFFDPLFLTTNRLSQPADELDTRSTITTDRFLAEDDLDPEWVAYTAPIVSSNPAEWDRLGPSAGWGAAASTHENMARGDQFFRSLGQRGWGPRGAPAMLALVHAWHFDTSKTPPIPLPALKERAAYYSPSTDALFFSDGEGCARLPAGVGLDVVVHEMTHAYGVHEALFTTEGEAGALNEAVADVLGASAEHMFGAPDDKAFLMGEDVFLDRVALRSIREPWLFDSRFAGERRKQASTYGELFPTSPATLANDKGHVHDNSTIASHAFYLMATGGVHHSTKVAVRDPVGWETSTRLWFTSTRMLSARYSDTFRHFARVNVNEAFFTFQPKIFSAVACAWRAVEVLTDRDLATYGVSCKASAVTNAPPPAGNGATSQAPGDCAGHGNDAVCSTIAPGSATLCRNGFPVNTAFCGDLAQRCKRRSSSDPTATIDAGGALVCEDP